MGFVVLLTVPLEAGAWSTQAGPLAPGPVPASVISCEFDDVPALLEGTVWLAGGRGGRQMMGWLWEMPWGVRSHTRLGG